MLFRSAGTGLPKFRDLIVAPKEEYKTVEASEDGWMGADENTVVEKPTRRVREAV